MGRKSSLRKGLAGLAGSTRQLIAPQYLKKGGWGGILLPTGFDHTPGKGTGEKGRGGVGLVMFGKQQCRQDFAACQGCQFCFQQAFYLATAW